MARAWFKGWVSGLGALVVLALCSAAQAQTEIPPPQGKGRVVVVASGQSGPQHYMTVSRAIAAMGYDVVLFDGAKMEGTKGQALKTAIQQAQQMPHALPGKVAVVGFSAGGGVALAYASQWTDLVLTDIVWYPATTVLPDPARFAAGIKLPVLMFAGESDTYINCCLITTARAIQTAAAAAGTPYTLFTYPGVQHDFVEGGGNYDPRAYRDALDKTGARLKEAFGP